MTGGAPRPPREARLWHSIKAVAWAFLGVRKDSEYQQDFARLNPLVVIGVGLVAIFALVLGLIAVVKWVT